MRGLLAPLRPLLVYAGLFSLAINLLLLAPPLYMLQVFDRVLSSRSGETLLVLSAVAIGALVLMALLDVLRARLLAAAGVALDRRLGPLMLDGLVARAARRGRRISNGLRDVARCARSSSAPGWSPCSMRLGCRSSSRSSSSSIRCSARWRLRGQQ